MVELVLTPLLLHGRGHLHEAAVSQVVSRRGHKILPVTLILLVVLQECGNLGKPDRVHHLGNYCYS